MFFVGKTVVNQPFGNGSSHHSRKMVMTLMTDYWVVAGHSHFSIKNWKKMDIRDREKKPMPNCSQKKLQENYGLWGI